VQAHTGKGLVQAYINESIIISCNSLGVAKWYYEKSRYYPKSSSIISSNKLIIEPTRVENSGFYFCYGVCPDLKKSFLSRVELRVYGM